MTAVRLRHVDKFRDRHGLTRYYYRRGKGARTPLPGAPGSKEFLEAYQNLQHAEPLYKKLSNSQAAAPYTFEWLAEKYLESQSFISLGERTQYNKKLSISKLFRELKIGHRPVASFTTVHLNMMTDKYAQTPGKAREMLSLVSVLMKHAIRLGIRNDNPAREIEKPKTKEYHTWTEEEIEKYEKCHPVGSMANAVFKLLLCTGQRGSDVIRMRWEDLRKGVLYVKQRKTGVELEIPILPELDVALAPFRREHGPIITHSNNASFSAGGFSQFMRRNIKLARLPRRCVPHGLRKAACRRMAEAGCTPHQIQAISGHRTLGMVEKYTRATNQKLLAQSAAARLAEKRQR